MYFLHCKLLYFISIENLCRHTFENGEARIGSGASLVVLDIKSPYPSLTTGGIVVSAMLCFYKIGSCSRHKIDQGFVISQPRKKDSKVYYQLIISTYISFICCNIGDYIDYKKGSYNDYKKGFFWNVMGVKNLMTKYSLTYHMQSCEYLNLEPMRKT